MGTVAVVVVVETVVTVVVVTVGVVVELPGVVHHCGWVVMHGRQHPVVVEVRQPGRLLVQHAGDVLLKWRQPGQAGNATQQHGTAAQPGRQQQHLLRPDTVALHRGQRQQQHLLRADTAALHRGQRQQQCQVAGGVALLQQEQHRGPAQGKVEVGNAGAAPPERATARWLGLQPTGGHSAEQVQRETGGHETPVGRGHA